MLRRNVLTALVATIAGWFVSRKAQAEPVPGLGPSIPWSQRWTVGPPLPAATHRELDPNPFDKELPLGPFHHAHSTPPPASTDDRMVCAVVGGVLTWQDNVVIRQQYPDRYNTIGPGVAQFENCKEPNGRFNLHAEVEVGTIDQLVAQYRHGLTRAVEAWAKTKGIDHDANQVYLRQVHAKLAAEPSGVVKVPFGYDPITGSQWPSVPAQSPYTAPKA